MTNPVNDIFRQASQGSVAAIIQVLNDKLADSGVRTRAIFADGVLQLLCEAATPEQLEQAFMTERVQKILEALSPRNIRRVNINSRIVREQQLLWLEEINRDPVGQLLWSKEIILKRPGLMQRISRDWKLRQADPTSGLPKFSPRQLREQRQFWRGGLAGGVTVALLLLGGWVLYSRMFSGSDASQTASATSQAPTSAPAVATNPVPPAVKNDPFADAVRVAEKAAQDGQSAQTVEDWRKLSAHWQKASDLMAQVPPSDKRYQTAQIKVNEYREKSDSLRQKAEAAQQTSSN